MLKARACSHLLAVIAPELAAPKPQKDTTTPTGSRGGLGSLGSRWSSGKVRRTAIRTVRTREESEASVKAELNLHVNHGSSTPWGSRRRRTSPPKWSTTPIRRPCAGPFDRAESAPHWRRRNGHHDASEYLLFNNGLVHVPTYLGYGKANYWVDPTSDYFSLAKLPV